MDVDDARSSKIHMEALGAPNVEDSGLVEGPVTYKLLWRSGDGSLVFRISASSYMASL